MDSGAAQAKRGVGRPKGSNGLPQEHTVSYWIKKGLGLSPAVTFDEAAIRARRIAETVLKDAEAGSHSHLRTVLDRTEGKVPDTLNLNGLDPEKILAMLRKELKQ